MIPIKIRCKHFLRVVKLFSSQNWTFKYRYFVSNFRYIDKNVYSNVFCNRLQDMVNVFVFSIINNLLILQSVVK